MASEKTTFAPWVVITTNACLYSSEQVSAMVAFLVKQQADIVFVQEANGFMDELLKVLRNNAGFEATVMDPTTHILLRRGHFQPLTDAWPRRFYSRAYLPDIGSDLLLLNLHLCEHAWDTGSNEDEQEYRGRYLQRMLDHLQSLPDATHTPLVVGGDFNAFSHQDESLYLPSDQLVYSRIYRRTVFCTRILSEAGLADCWRACHPDSRTSLESKGVPFLSWPVPPKAIEHDPYLPAEIESHEVAGRIDFLFVNGCIHTLGCEMVHEPTHWYSDHLAVVARLTIDSLPAKPCINPHLQSLTRSTVEPSLSLRVLLSPANPPVWLLSASGWSGGKNSYIEIETNEKEKPPVSLGWFYADGLQNTQDCSVAECRKYLYGTFNPNKPVYTEHACFQARLYDDAQRELARASVKIERL